MNDGLAHLMPNRHFVEGIRIMKAQVGNHQGNIVQPVDDLRTDHSGRRNCVSALHCPIGKILIEHREYDALEQPVSVDTLGTGVITNRADDKTVLVGLGHCPSSLGRLGRLWAGYSCLLLPTCAPITLGAVEQNQWIARLDQAAAPSCGLADALLDVGGGGAHRY